jgi:hypothetical protein
MSTKSNPLLDNQLPNAMVLLLPGSKRQSEKLEHGWRIVRPDGQIAAGYVSDNADGNAVEFALNEQRLPELPLERAPLLLWLHYQRKIRGQRPVNVHQRGDPVSWFRIGFSTIDEALSFLQEMRRQSRMPDPRSRWKTPAGFEIEESIVSTAVDGNRSNEEVGVACIPFLIAHVLAQYDAVMQPLTYEELADLVDRRKHNGKLSGEPMALGMGDVLAKTMVHIDRAAALLDETLPYLTLIVVDKSGVNKGLPGNGVAGRWPDYPKLTQKEKIDRIELEYAHILEYGQKWLDVLHVLELSFPPPEEDVQANSSLSGRAGGESPQHEALKEFIATHPELVDAPTGTKGMCEFALRSADEIDVLFKSPQLWVGVEVKASTSEGNFRDYERGLYQVVKYRAVLEAQARIDHPGCPPDVRVVLALEMSLPNSLYAVADALGIRLIENIGEIPEFAIAKNKRRTSGRHRILGTAIRR